MATRRVWFSSGLLPPNKLDALFLLARGVCGKNTTPTSLMDTILSRDRVTETGAPVKNMIGLTQYSCTVNFLDLLRLY